MVYVGTRKFEFLNKNLKRYPENNYEYVLKENQTSKSYI